MTITATSRTYQQVNWKIDQQKNTIIIGDSHTECALNDSIISNSINISQSGTSYYYSYLKLKTLLKENQHIDTILLGFSYHNLEKSQNKWLFGYDYIKNKLPSYFLLMNWSDFTYLFKNAPISTGLSFQLILKKNYKHLFSTEDSLTIDVLDIGGFRYLERNKLEEAKEILSDTNMKDLGSNLSNSEIKYLRKIEQLCREENRELILLTTPIHPFLLEQERLNFDHFTSLKKRILPDVEWYDFSNLTMKDSLYGDLDHLNFMGAELFSNFFKKGLFESFRR